MQKDCHVNLCRFFSAMHTKYAASRRSHVIFVPLAGYSEVCIIIPFKSVYLAVIIGFHCNQSPLYWVV